MYWPFLHCFCHLLAEMFGNLQSGNNEISVAQSVSIHFFRWCSSERPRQSTNHFCTSLACTWWNLGRTSISDQNIYMNLQYVRTLVPFWCSSVRPSILIHYFWHVLGNVLDEIRTNFNFSSSKCVDLQIVRTFVYCWCSSVRPCIIQTKFFFCLIACSWKLRYAILLLQTVGISVLFSKHLKIWTEKYQTHSWLKLESWINGWQRAAVL